MGCANCGHANPGSARFCNECGSALGAESVSRRRPVDYTPRHLAERVLRSRAALEGERKLVTVLFADLVGSLELARHFDPEAWHRILDGFFEILTGAVHRFEGTVNQYTGDGMMALFGAPLAHEDHAQRACHAALRIAADVREFGEVFRRSHGRDFEVRMGLNAGEVVVGRIGDDLRMDYTAQGHVVGLAARMEQIAEPGTVAVTAQVAELVDGFFELRALGTRDLPGVGGPLPVFSVVGEGPLETRLERAGTRGFSRLVGRDGALTTLEKALDRARQGAGLAVGVEGEAGVGKSRLCLEFARRCRQRGLEVWEAHCPAHGRGVPHLAVRALLRSYFGLERDQEPDRSLLADRVRELGVREDLALLLELLGVPDPEETPARLEPAVREQRLARVLSLLIRARTRREAAVVLVDDLHWIDPESEALLALLLDEIGDSRCLLLVNFRPEHREAWMTHAGFHELGLRPLDPPASGELFRALVGTDPSTERLAERVHESAGGNPFFIEEVVRSLAERGRLTGSPGSYAWVGSGDEELGIPATVTQLLAARIDRLADADKDLLQVAAVIGKRFGGGLLAEVAGRAEGEVAAALRRLESAGFVRRESQYPQGDSAFHHALTQEVAYGSLLRERRVRLHRAVARALEEHGERLGERAPLIAHHWDAADAPYEAARWRRRAAFRVTNIVPRRRRPYPGPSDP